MPDLLIINGPNLNLLGSREPDRYGSDSLASLESDLRAQFPTIEFDLNPLSIQ